MANQSSSPASAPVTDMAALLQSRVMTKLSAAAAAADTPTPVIPISTWMSIISAVISALQQCRAAKAATGGTTTPTPTTATINQELATTVANPTLIQRVKVRRLMMQNVGRPAYRKYGDEIHEYLFQVAAEASPQERLAFVEQAAAG